MEISIYFLFSIRYNNTYLKMI